MNLMSTIVYVVILVAFLLLQSKQEVISWFKQKHSSKFVFFITSSDYGVYVVKSNKHHCDYVSYHIHYHTSLFIFLQKKIMYLV